MGLDLWFRVDVARILNSALETTTTTSRAMRPRSQYEQTQANSYLRGFAAAIHAVATAFGVTDLVETEQMITSDDQTAANEYDQSDQVWLTGPAPLPRIRMFRQGEGR